MVFARPSFRVAHLGLLGDDPPVPGEHLLDGDLRWLFLQKSLFLKAMILA